MMSCGSGFQDGGIIAGFLYFDSLKKAGFPDPSDGLSVCFIFGCFLINRSIHICDIRVKAA